MNLIKVVPFALTMLQECVDLYQQVFSKEPWFENSERSDVEKYFLNFLDNNKFLGYVAICEDKIIAVSLGFLKPWIKGEEYYIDQFYVDYNLQGKGVGTYFFDQIKLLLLEINIRAVMLATEKGFPSYDFYKKIGFHHLEELCFLGIEF